jgi:Tfp pilus assembly protein PilE
MRNQKGFTLVELFFVIWALVALGIGGTVLYVAGHFIAKFW